MHLVLPSLSFSNAKPLSNYVNTDKEGTLKKTKQASGQIKEAQ